MPGRAAWFGTVTPDIRALAAALRRAPLPRQSRAAARPDAPRSPHRPPPARRFGLDGQRAQHDRRDLRNRRGPLRCRVRREPDAVAAMGAVHAAPAPAREFVAGERAQRADRGAVPGCRDQRVQVAALVAEFEHDVRRARGEGSVVDFFAWQRARHDAIAARRCVELPVEQRVDHVAAHALVVGAAPPSPPPRVRRD